MGRYSKSSTLLQTTLFIIIAGIIAATIFYVYQSTINTSKTLKSAGNSNIEVKKPTAQAKTAAPALEFVNN